ncbi:hypothetical protein H6F77_22005 [Microcoleus sp. FACHB-831]|uniref:hypothetical protein n=1 Tax=Microcoleus sp. FACHB-831 TaxID=2692827 RepID=UPI00168556B2|nr:hypothetical protein [Microcoleus sp. FACHB-831]MBD1923720.1 hypothetical protein [Microcoleus sp. FACHB-831]
MATKKPHKSQKPQSAPATTKLNLIALKPLSKTPETQTSSPASVEPPVPVEPSVPVEALTSGETPTSITETKKILKPIKRSPSPTAEINPSLPENPDAIFQAVGIIVGEVAFSDKKAFVTIADKQYPLFYASSHKKAFDALKLHLKKTAESQLRLIVYPKVMHFPSREQPYVIGFQLVGFTSVNVTPIQSITPSDSSSIDRQLQDREFKLSGLWQFIPVCQTPCITIQKNFSDERLTYIKEAPPEQKVNFMKASHIPLLWRNAPVKPFRFNPKLDKEQQGQASFIEIKAIFLPEKDVFEFSSLRSLPSNIPPRSLKAGKKEKAQALQAKNQRKQELGS